MILCCVVHKQTCCNGRWEKHQKELHELNIVGPITIEKCPECYKEMQKEYDFLRRTLPAKEGQQCDE